MYGIRQQHNIKVSRYTINLSQLSLETKLLYSSGPNPVRDLRETYEQGVRFYPLVVGVGGHQAETSAYLSDILDCPSVEVRWYHRRGTFSHHRRFSKSKGSLFELTGSTQKELELGKWESPSFVKKPQKKRESSRTTRGYASVLIELFKPQQVQRPARHWHDSAG